VPPSAAEEPVLRRGRAAPGGRAPRRAGGTPGARFATEAQRRAEPAADSLGWFLDRVVAARGQLVMPLHGGPTELTAETAVLRDEVHAAIATILRRDDTIRADVTPCDVVVFGAMLAQPLPAVPDRDATSRRQKPRPPPLTTQ
jgi:hypothetical protein